MDPFEVRLQFLGQLKKLTASQQSIQSIAQFAYKHAERCRDDVWDCILGELSKGTLNTRINILYFLDSLCDPVHPLAPSTSTINPYPRMLAKDLRAIVDLVVPQEKEGVLNLLATKQILQSWRTRRVAPPEECEAIIASLEARRQQPVDPDAPPTPAGKKRGSSSLANFSRQDTLRRMEEDRERHKRLRERGWVVPRAQNALGVPPGVQASPAESNTISNPSPFTPASPGTFVKHDSPAGAVGTDGSAEFDIEFDQAWEDGSDLDEEDFQAMREERQKADAVSKMYTRETRQEDMAIT